MLVAAVQVEVADMIPVFYKLKVVGLSYDLVFPTYKLKSTMVPS